MELHRLSVGHRLVAGFLLVVLGTVVVTALRVAAAACSTTESVAESQQAAVELADVSGRLQDVTSQFRP